jgi:hypothetical protein
MMAIADWLRICKQGYVTGAHVDTVCTTVVRYSVSDIDCKNMNWIIG